MEGVLVCFGGFTPSGSRGPQRQRPFTEAHLQPPTKLQLLAKQKWATRLFLVFDISNTSYDAELGHLPEQNQLPVLIVRLGQKVQAYPASLPAQNRVNDDIARAHNDNGINSLPPFMVDYTSGPPVYLNPRDPSLLL